jgi:hypothetical protein
MWLLAILIGCLIPNKKPDRDRVRHVLGLFSPEMRPHWQRLREQPSFHAYSNIWTEWTRLDPQRAWKTMSALIDLAVVAAILL